VGLRSLTNFNESLRYSLVLNRKIRYVSGRQRSAISVAVYLVVKYNMTPGDACKYIMDKRKEAFHFGLSLNFEDSLNKYYRNLQKSKRK